MKVNKKLIHFVIIVSLIVFAVLIRIQPLGLPVTDDWAEQTLTNNVRDKVTADVVKEFPSSSERAVREIVENRTKQVITANQGKFDENKANLSLEFKGWLKRDSDDQIYLNTIDAWYWYQLANDYNDNGFMGNVRVNGSNYDKLMRGQHLHPAQFTIHPYSIAKLYQLGHFFNKNVTMMGTASFISVILFALGIIPLYLLGNRFAGWIGGVVSCFIVAVHPATIVRTLVGMGDYDAWHFFLPILAFWLFIESYYVGKGWLKNLLIVLCGGVLALHSTFWTGWVYIFDIIVATLVITALFNWWRKQEWKSEVKKVVILIVSTSIIGGLFTFVFNRTYVGFLNVYQAISLPIWFIKYQTVAMTDLFPNVLTTVAELNKSSFEAVIVTVSAGIFFGAVLGIVFESINNRDNIKYGVLLSLWLLATTYSSINGLRFVALLLPCLAISIGCFVKIMLIQVPKWLDKSMELNIKWTRGLVLIVVIFMLGALTVQGIGVARSQAPMMNDGWYNTLEYVEHNTAEDSVITTWWDFGHWIKAISRRSVTFDGGDQEHRIYWVGKLFLTADERESMGILRMLNCDQTVAYNKMLNYTGDVVLSIDVLTDVTKSDEAESRVVLEGAGLSSVQVDDVLVSTHCEPVDQYVITSSDMIGKAPVWSYFGSWNFTIAKNGWGDAGVRYGYQSINPVIAPYPLNESLFTKLHLQEYKGTSFTLIQQGRTVYGELINVWKVNWEVIE